MLEHLKPFNFILAADGYKANHWLELPEDVEYAYVTVVPRKASKYSNEIVAMGQTMLASLLASVRITENMIDEAEREITEQGYNFNRRGWEQICRLNNGILPLSVFGVEEGRVVKPQTPIVGISNTLPRYAWLVTYIETFAQSLLWKMSTVASICRSSRKILEEYCLQTGTPLSQVDYMFHNFGDRGADSPHEAAVIAGIAHAALFDGSDCLRANGYIKQLYNTSKVYTTSIEATEHSVMCAHSNTTERDDWNAANMAVDRLYQRISSAKTGIGVPAVSVVIDTYNSRRFVEEYIGTKLYEFVRTSGGKLILRPDSGDPTVEPGIIGNILVDKFGAVTRYIDDQVYKVLPDYLGVIQGDGIRIDTLESVLKGWIDAGLAMDNFALGAGSGITHDGSRDDFSFSMKVTAYYVKDKWISVIKEPTTDLSKSSLTGLVRCAESETGELFVYSATGLTRTDAPGWRCFYSDGYRQYRQTFDDVRSFARK